MKEIIFGRPKKTYMKLDVCMSVFFMMSHAACP